MLNIKSHLSQLLVEALNVVAPDALNIPIELTRPKLPGSWLPNGAPHEWRDGEIAIVARATDETAKIDLNAAGEVLLRGLFTSVGGADPDLAVRTARRPPTTRGRDRRSYPRTRRSRRSARSRACSA